MDADKVEALVTGSLVENIKNNMRYTITGIVLGAVTGVVVATFFNKNRMIFALIGAASFGASGYLMKPK